MTDVMNGQVPGQVRDGAELPAADEQLLRELTERARHGGLTLTGEGGLLARLTKMVAGARWRASSMITWVMRRTTRPAVTAVIPVTATARRRC